MPANRGVSGVTLNQFFTAVLKGLGAPVTENNLLKLAAVARLEGHGGNYNPFNSVGKSPGSTRFNSAGVQNYANLQSGIDATIRLLRQGNTTGMRSNLISNATYDGFTSAATQFYKSWGGPAVRTTPNNARVYLDSILDGPPVPQHEYASVGGAAAGGAAAGGSNGFYNWQGQPAGAAQSGRYNQLSPHLAGFQSWLLANYGGNSLGGHVDRPVRGGSAPSSHAFGAATDWGYSDRAKADSVLNYVIANADRLGIQAVHDYGRMRVWRAGRGWKDQPKGSHGGLMNPGTKHLHFEVNEANWGTPFDANAQGSAQQFAQGGSVSDPHNWAGIRQNIDQNESTFNEYLNGQTPERKAQILAELKKGRSLPEVAEYMASAPKEVNDYIKFLAGMSADQQEASKARIGAPDPGAVPPDPVASKEMTDLLKTFGVSYPNAPQPTPALLAFLRGIGLNMSTAEDAKRRAIERIGASTTDAMTDIDRAAGRSKQNVTADLVRRGVLSSGESNTRYARHAEDVGEQKGDVTRASATAKEAAEVAYQNARDAARQQALDRVINAETDQNAQRAASRAQEEAFKRQQAAADQAWQRQQQAQNDSIARQEQLMREYGNQGVVV
jgi:hypothetical protein